MGNTITIDPVTRLEGHLKVKVETDGHAVEKAYIAGNLFRDFENILKGRQPWDAVHITQRICGVCPVSHAITATKAAEQIAGFAPNDQALLIRAIIQGAYFISDHILHFYHLNLPDYISPPQLTPLRPGYSVDMRFSPTQTTSLFNNYLEGLKIRRQAQEMVAILAGRIPHVMSIVPGGVTQSPSQAQIDQLKGYLAVVRDFVLNKYLPDTYLLAEVYGDYFRVGTGPGNLLCFSAFDLPGNKSLFRQGLMTNFSRQQLSLSEIKEFVRFAYYSSRSGLNPKDGDTVPLFGKSGAYSWLKAPRYKDNAYETGPLARMTINGYYKGSVSVMDRIMARALETKMLVEYLPLWIDRLTADAATYTDISIPPLGYGVGLTEAPRGALGHWVQYCGGKISRYQIITPTCWNASPRDDKGNPGPMERALIGTSIQSEDQPVELLRIIHSYDPCVSCSVHVLEVPSK